MWKKRLVDENGHFHEFNPEDNYYKLYVRFLEPYLGKLIKYGDFLGGYKGCAQFISSEIGAQQRAPRQVQSTLTSVSAFILFIP